MNKEIKTKPTVSGQVQRLVRLRQRKVVWFSCGAASAVAAKIAVQKYDGEITIVYCDPGGEHPDNQSFLKDIESWIDHRIIILKNDKYKDHFDCCQQRGYLGDRKGAPCTLLLKKQLRQQYEKPDDIHIFGYTYDEQSRGTAFNLRNPELFTEWMLINEKITKDNCLGLLWQAGIKIPTMYLQGYPHNNCIGCVKGRAGYWNMIRRDYPEQFAKMAKLEREIGYALNRIDDKRIYLDELNPNVGNIKTEPAIACDLGCGLIYNEITA